MSPIMSVAKAFRRPERRHGDPGLIRALLSRRGVFDAVSTAMQMRDLRRQSRIHEVAPAAGRYYASVHAYNAGVTQHKLITRTRRAEYLFDVLRLPPRDLGDERLLLIGPRNAHELLQAWVAGFAWRNISGIDLYSTNPKIAIMNMEAMTFADATFDAILMANTLSYAESVTRCLGEVARVLRPGGQAVFGHSHVPEAKDFKGNAVSGREVKEAVRGLGLDIYFHHAHAKLTREGLSMTSHAFGVRKPSPADGLDRAAAGL